MGSSRWRLPQTWGAAQGEHKAIIMSLLTTCQIFTEWSLVKKASIITMLAPKIDRDVTPSALPWETATKPSLPSRAIAVHAGFTPVSIQGLLSETFSWRNCSRKKPMWWKLNSAKIWIPFYWGFFSSCVHSRVRDELPFTVIMINIKILPLNMKICATQATNCSISLQGPWACIYSQVSGHCEWGDLFHLV